MKINQHVIEIKEYTGYIVFAGRHKTKWRNKS